MTPNAFVEYARLDFFGLKLDTVCRYSTDLERYTVKRRKPFTWDKFKPARPT